MSTEKVVNANIIPSEAAVREFIKQFREALASDPNLLGAFRLFPEEVLASRGIASDLQKEILTYMGVSTAAGCMVTCYVTEIIIH